MSLAPLDVLASRLGLEPGEIEHAGAGRATIDATAGGEATHGRWFVLAEGARAPGAARSSVACRLAEAFDARGSTGVATMAAPSLAQALAGRGLRGLALDLEGQLRPIGAEAAVRDAAELLAFVAREAELDHSDSSPELAQLLLLSRDERELARRLGRMTLGERADGRQCLLEAALPSVAALLVHALRPTLVRTERGSAALLGGLGPCSASVATTSVALRTADAVFAAVSGPASRGVRHALELVGPRAGAAPSAIVLTTDLAGLRFASGELGDVRASELERVLAADDSGLVERGLARWIEDAPQLDVPLLFALEQRDHDRLESCERVLDALAEVGYDAVLLKDDASELAERLEVFETSHAIGRSHADLATLAHAAARAAGATGDLALLPEPAAKLRTWARLEGLDVVVEGPSARVPWTIVDAELGTGAGIVRLRATEARPEELGRESWTTLRRDAWGRLELP